MKIVLIGGHFSPALAVITRLRNDHEIVVFGRKYTFEGDKTISLEYRLCQDLGIPFEEITTGRLQRKISHQTFASLGKIPVGFWDSIRILKKHKPDTVVGFGGYLSIPVGLASYILGIPLIIHEQTLHAGLANKILGKFATKVCISFSSSAPFFDKNKVTLTGNPLRAEIITSKIVQKTEKKRPLLYITGGSAGAHFINDLVGDRMEELLSKVSIIHQTGDSQVNKDYEKLTDLRNKLPADLQKEYKVEKFFTPKEVAEILKDAELIISRSGINTVCELLYLEKPCLLIPLPHGQNSEQLGNAKLVKKVGLGEYLVQSDAKKEQFLQQIFHMLANLDSYSGQEGEKLIIQDADKKLCDVIESIYTPRI